MKINIIKNYEQITNILSIIISIPLIFLSTLFILKKLRKIISSDLDRQVLGILIDKLLGFLFGFILNYIIFSTLMYCSSNFEFLSFINIWLKENSIIIMMLDNFNEDIIIYITGEKETIITN